MAIKAGGAYIEIRGEDKKLPGDLKKAHSKIKTAAVKMEKRLTQVFKVMGVAAIVGISASLVVLTKKVVALGREFESNMKTVQAWSGASGKALQDLTDIARKMGATTEYTATEAAGALKFLAAAGFTAKQSIAALPGTLDLATAGQVDLASATDITTDVLTAFGMQVEELNRVSDAFITTSSSSNTNVLMLGESFKMVAPTAHLFRLSVEQTSAMLGTLANSGIKAEMAGSGLNMVLMRSAVAAKKLGMEAGTPLIAILKRMKEEQWSAVQIGEAFGVRQVKTAAILMNNIDMYEKLTKKIIDNAGATEKLADIIRDSLDVDLKTLNSTIQEELLRTFDKYKDYMREVVQSTTEWIRQNPQAIEQVAELARNLFELVIVMGKIVNLGVEFTNIWIKTWQAMGLVSSGVIDFRTAMIDGASAIKTFNEEMGSEKLRLAYLERIVASGKYTWQVEKEIKVLKALIESRKTLTALKAPSRLETALVAPDEYYGALPETLITEVSSSVYKQTEEMKARYVEYYAALEEMAENADMRAIMRERERLKELEPFIAARHEIWLSAYEAEEARLDEYASYRTGQEKSITEQIRAIRMTDKTFALATLKEKYENYKNFTDDLIGLELWRAAKEKEIQESGYDDMTNAMMGWANNFSSTLNDMLWGAEVTFASILESFMKMITQMMIQAAIMGPLTSGITGLFSGLFSAQGNVFSQSGLQPFAQGGIVNKPTQFAFAGGVGLMGEAGPEAIMPLTRTPRGDLGVKAVGEPSGKPQKQTVQIILNNPTFQDLETQRQTMAQIASVVAAQVAPGAVIENYENDLGIRQMVRGGI